MWFKNLRLFHLLEPFAQSEQALNEQLQGQAFRSCGSHEASTLGWVSPLGRRSEKLAHEIAGWMMICARQEERLLPAAVVTESLEEKIAAIESEEGRRVARRERTELRDDIIHQLMPKAFVRTTRTFAMIDRQQGWILVDVPGSNKAEAIVSLLRETLGSLQARPIEVEISPTQVMTDWLQQPTKYPDFVLMDSCELRDMDEEGGTIRCRGQDLASDEIQAHLAAGKQVSKLAVTWDERLSFVLEADLAIKRIKFLDIIQEAVADVQSEDEIAQFDLSFSLMGLEFRRLIPRLLDLFGGLSK